MVVIDRTKQIIKDLEFFIQLLIYQKTRDVDIQKIMFWKTIKTYQMVNIYYVQIVIIK